ncbi:MAG: hypothetical protein ACRD2T_11380, partial [Thermoanaerobaculia bacterium]
LAVVGVFESGGDNADQAELLEIMRSGYERLEAFITKGLEYFQWLGTERTSKAEKVDLAQVARSAAAELPALTAPGVVFHLCVPEAECPVSGSMPALDLLNGGPTWPPVLDLGLRERVQGRVFGSEGGQMLGDRLVAAGDVDGDGWMDLLATERLPGRTMVHLLPGNILPPFFDVSLGDYLSGLGGASFELTEHRFLGPKDIHLGPAGDVDGDGFGDFLLGDEEGGVGEKGLVYLIRGRREREFPVVVEVSPEPVQPDGILRIRGAGRQAGRVGPAGDFNEDGFADFLVAEYPFSPLRPGSFYLLFGRPDLPETIHLARPGRNGIRIDGQHMLTRPWLSRQIPGDLNGDGAGDLVLSEASNAGYAGAVYLVFGPSADFIRGDANRDGRVDITDAVAVVRKLFLGDPSVLCEDGADADDDGVLSITDTIYLVTHLFLGGLAPPPPYPEAGRDRTADGLRCRAF